MEDGGLEKMDGVSKRFRISNPEDECIKQLQKYCEFSNIIFKVPVISKPLCIVSECHNNVNYYVNTYGGEKVVGYYLITDINDANCGCAIYHSIWRNTYGILIDITPFEDNRNFNMFCQVHSENYYSGVFYNGTDYKILTSGKVIL